MQNGHFLSLISKCHKELWKIMSSNYHNSTDKHESTKSQMNWQNNIPLSQNSGVGTNWADKKNSW